MCCVLETRLRVYKGNYTHTRTQKHNNNNIRKRNPGPHKGRHAKAEHRDTGTRSQRAVTA